MIAMSYEDVLENFDSVFGRVGDGREVVIIRRPGHEPVALIATAELASLQETVHLLRSRRNAERLFASLARATRGESSSTDL